MIYNTETDTTYTQQTQQLEAYSYFPSTVYTALKPEFLPSVRSVYQDYYNKEKSLGKMEELYPMLQTGSFFHEPKIQGFTQFVADTAWEILRTQGFNMENKGTYFTEMWGHYYQKFGSMEQHVHNNSVQIAGFYFLDVPPKSSKVIFHDPRSGKNQINMFEQDESQVTLASSMINFEPREGMFIFTNAWLAHSLTRHGSPKPLKFVHFNLGVMELHNQSSQQCPVDGPEII
jgi:uncharacterized protein (TIGR02466 family)